MSRYDFECTQGHTTEHEFPIGTAPILVACTEPIRYYPLGPETEGELEDCEYPAKRLPATGVSFLVNKIMSPPSKRVKPGHVSL